MMKLSQNIGEEDLPLVVIPKKKCAEKINCDEVEEEG